MTKIELLPIPISSGASEMLELTEYCRAEIEKAFALPRECFLPPRPKPIILDFSPLFTRINELLSTENDAVAPTEPRQPE